MIRAATPADAESLAVIYDHYVSGAIFTFETEVVDTAEMARRVSAIAAAGLPWLVAEVDGRVRAYAYASLWHERTAYRFTVETTVYVEHDHVRSGLGGRLYRDLLESLSAGGVHAAIGKIALPNPASVALHEKLGFEKVAHLREAGWKFDHWIDVGYWERLLP